MIQAGSCHPAIDDQLFDFTRNLIGICIENDGYGNRRVIVLPEIAPLFRWLRMFVSLHRIR